EIIIDRLLREFKVQANVGKPEVAYRETVRGKAESEGKYIKQSGGRGQYGHVVLRVEPSETGAGLDFVNKIVGGIIPREYIPAIAKGVKERMETGVLAGYAMRDIRVTLYDGSFHEVDSSEMAFKIAGSLALKKGVQQATPIILEPVMTVEVSAPDDAIGDVIGDLNSRRGRVMGVEAKSKNQAIRAMVPLAEMLEYAPQLRSLTADRGDYTMEFSHYEEVPAHIQEKLVAGAKQEEQED
ncbi:MAG: elongation factor G, partial [candidate division NC10 bacterium]|nr:elongation factor G [candidate division NC10 bacterium]